MTMKLTRYIYVCSPFKGDPENNVKRAREYCRDVILEGLDNMQIWIPMAPHAYFTQGILDDNSIDERNVGIAMGLDWLKLCDEIWVYDQPTTGMAIEIGYASCNGIKVVYKNVY
jgi:hypothetical protein